MKLAEHVHHIKSVTHNAFDNLFARLGIRTKELAGEELIPDRQLSKRAKILELIDSHKEEKDDYSEARNRALEELTFTLFNRFAAVKVMEAKTLFPEIITKRPENGDRSFQHKAWLEQNPNMRSEELEGLREFIKHAFDNLGEELALYHKSYPYALLPNTIDLNEIIEAFNAVEKDNATDDRIWASDDILGWLYESYNNDKKVAFKEDGGKTEYDKVSLQSQVYTPRWVVEFLVNNSLGKLYLEMYPTSDIKNRKKIANAPQKQLREPKPLREVTLIDPAPGSGNFLLYAFDLFYELYVDQIEFFGADYEEEDIPKLIIEHNLFGIDLDDRAVQLAQLGLYIKAKSKNRNTSVPSFHVVSSDFYLPDFETVRPLFEGDYVLESGVIDLLKEIWNDLQNAHKFGSLLKIEDRVNRRLEKFKEEPMDLFVQDEVAKYGEFEEKFFPRIRKAVQEHANGNTTAFVKEKTLDALTYLEIITQKYDVAVANPPYTDSSDFGSELKKFIGNNYKEPYKFHTNLYASFIQRTCDLTNDQGKIAQVHPPTFMYIKSFEDVRKYIIDKTHIHLFVEWGYLGMFNPKARVDSAMYVLEKGEIGDDTDFIKINHLYETKRKDALFEAVNASMENNENKNLYTLKQGKLKKIKTWPLIYWISDDFREKFSAKSMGQELKMCSGLGTGDNARFMRFWWEVDKSKISFKKNNNKWTFIAKGGPYNKWQGNLWIVLNWENDGYEIKNFYDENGKKKSTIRNEPYYFTEGISFAKAGSKTASFRYIPDTSIFDSSSPAIFPENFQNLEYSLAFLNSILSSYLLECLNPTSGTQVGDMKRIPFVIPDALTENLVTKFAEQCIQFKRELGTYRLIEPNFKENPLFNLSKDEPVLERLQKSVCYEIIQKTLILINEALIDEQIFDLYELNNSDKMEVISEIGLSPSTFNVSKNAKLNFLESIGNKYIHIKSFIDSLAIRDDLSLSTIKKDNPEKVFQNNNDLGEFCINKNLNPIDVWNYYNNTEVTTNERYNELVLEFLTINIRHVLEGNDDGIVPLVKNSGEEILIEKLERRLQKIGMSTQQISQLDNILGKPLNEYLVNYFFKEYSDHLNLFNNLPRTPFIWHLSSGPEKGFDCYLVIYKWSRDKLLSLKSVYIEKRERALKNRLTDLGDRSDAASQNERDTIQKQLEEIVTFKDKIDDLIASGYDPILDDGVGKNIAPLQKRGMIPYDVLTDSQLKKYLNADW